MRERLAPLIRNKVLIAAVAFVALFLASLYINSYTANIIESKEKTEVQLSTCQENLTMCRESATSFQQLLTECTNNNTVLQTNFNLCSAESQKMAEDYRSVSLDLGSCQANYSSISKSFSELSSEFEQVVNSSAASICCIKRVLVDATLKYFYVKDGVIYCTSVADESLGTKEFTCQAS
jgi:type VI protein secretion system component Hcp